MFLDPVVACALITIDPRLVSEVGDILLEPTVINGPDGTRLYTPEVTSGEWYSNTFAELCSKDEFGRVLWCILFYLDGTNVTKKIGGRSLYPLWISLANLRSGVRTRRTAW